ncbi:MAG: hypothetical protein Q9157_004237 [Trypethelium eluteriae]
MSSPNQIKSRLFGGIPIQLASSNAAQVSSATWANPGDWHGHKQTIKRLWIDEDRPLKDVMAVMEKDYGLKGTAKMYRSRIKSWGLDNKNNRENNMKTIVRKKLQRDAVGKRSVFFVKGRKVNSDEIVRYCKRKGIDPDSAIDFIEGCPSTPPGITCATPHNSPSPVSLGSSSSNAMPVILQPPEKLLIPEHIFRSIKDYVNGAVDSGLWHDDGLGNCLSTRASSIFSDVPRPFCDAMSTAKELMQSRSFPEMRYMLSKAFDACTPIAKGQNPHSMTRLLMEELRFINYGDSMLVDMIRKHMAALSIRLLGPGHGWSRIFHFLEQVELEKISFSAVIENCLASLADIFNQNNLFDLSAVDVRLVCLRISPNPGGLQRLEDQLRDRLVRMAASHSEDFSYQKTLYRLGTVMRMREKYEVAITMFEEISTHTAGTGQGHWEIRSLEQQAILHKHMYNETSAEEKIRQSLAKSVHLLGSGDALSCWLKAEYEKWLREWNRHAEADELRAEFSASVVTDPAV